MPPFDRLSLHTERLLLRPIEEADAPALLAVFGDERVMRYWSTPPWRDIGDAHAAIARYAKAMASAEHLRLGVERVADGAFIGTCTLFDLNEQCRRAEIGYALAATAWGQGYMHEALIALLAYGFSQLDLNRVEADIDPRNAASSRTLERLAFRKEGHLRERWIVDGEVSDTSLYGLLRSDWASALESVSGDQSPR
jgi:[ribosomal protein S5]-alanine N-acetyltransferase